MENQIIPDEIIMNQIYYVRGQKVMLDKDLAELYQVTTGNLNKLSPEILSVSPKTLCSA